MTNPIKFQVQPAIGSRGPLPTTDGVQLCVNTGGQMSAFSLFMSPDAARQLAIDLVSAAEAYEKAASTADTTIDMFRDARTA